jgi:hypothetical protein
VIQAGGWKLPLRFLEEYVEACHTCHLALALLWTLGLNKAFSRGVLRHPRVLPVVLAAMQRHRTDRDVQHQGCGLLALLAFAADSNRYRGTLPSIGPQHSFLLQSQG